MVEEKHYPKMLNKDWSRPIVDFDLWGKQTGYRVELMASYDFSGSGVAQTKQAIGDW